MDNRLIRVYVLLAAGICIPSCVYVHFSKASLRTRQDMVQYVAVALAECALKCSSRASTSLGAFGTRHQYQHDRVMSRGIRFLACQYNLTERSVCATLIVLIIQDLWCCIVVATAFYLQHR